MRQFMLFVLLIPALAALTSCTDTDIDDVKPIIDLSVEGTFPRNCDTLYLGKTFTFRATFSDNEQLGGFSIDIHQNFDHHSHSTEVTACTFSPVKEPVNPFQYTMDFEIPEGLTTYVAEVEIEIPAEDSEGAIDPGDYHFFIHLTDRVGWSAEKGLSVKLVARD